MLANRYREVDPTESTDRLRLRSVVVRAHSRRRSLTPCIARWWAQRSRYPQLAQQAVLHSIALAPPWEPHRYQGDRPDSAKSDLRPEAGGQAPSEQGSPRAGATHPAQRRSTSRSTAVPEVRAAARGIQRRHRNAPSASEPCGIPASAHTSGENRGPIPYHEIAPRPGSAPERSDLRPVSDEPEVFSDAGFGVRRIVWAGARHSAQWGPAFDAFLEAYFRSVAPGWLPAQGSDGP